LSGRAHRRRAISGRDRGNVAGSKNVVQRHRLSLALEGAQFLSIDNLRNILVQSTFVLFISVGMTFVLTVGAIDLSVGAALGLSAGVTIFVISLGVPSVIAIAAGLAVGVCIGLLDGFMVAWLRLNDFIVTLGTLSIAAGALQLMDSFRPLRATGADYFTGLAHGVWWGVPVPVIIAVVVVGFMSAVMQLSDYGRRLQATGMNSAAANLAGVNVRSIRLSVFVLSGFFSGLAGVVWPRISRRCRRVSGAASNCRRSPRPSSAAPV